ncbi:uncharacterized protein N7518_004424 [Penicillium psychrosexuale]|uniref:uncharacterized protein n=1 Tax=Penicillium psychrosexuale TaxID=1002107 RepID=UPI002545137D|nr:uncharacterized protein N7518_004424 [Penicillium psychrosexuale]KAJ5795884.1 hypothetical protein N7518_004424 [Penicillium psychrosexuale]
MDRRKQASTDDSEYSITESIKDFAPTGFQLAKDTLFPLEDIAAAKPEDILTRMLSTKSYISTTSSLAELNNAARDNPSQHHFLEIGQGQCGTVYAIVGTDTVAKLPNSPAKVPQLLIDFKMHASVKEAMDDVENLMKLDIHIPKLYSWETPESNSFWINNSLYFPKTADVQNFALISSRVFPIPLPVREAIVDVLCPPTLQEYKSEFLAKPENKNCLIRVYLGRRMRNRTNPNVKDFKLRNFPLHVNEMEFLQLDTSAFAQVMAQTLAILHWKAGVDGNDVEFILGSSPLLSPIPRSDEITGVGECSLGHRFDLSRRSISLWLIDFNMCAKFEKSPAGLKLIVDAFIWNDPYYPSPELTTANDKKLWSEFRKRYLEVSRVLTTSAMPGQFIAEIENRGRKANVGELF